jgi:hypothetical protein
MAHYDLNVIRQYWRGYNYKHQPSVEKNTEAVLSFDIREDYLEMLKEAGYDSNEEVIAAGPDEIEKINGIGPSTVRKIFSTELEV